MVQVHIHGKMEEGMKDNINLLRSMGMEFIHGQMGEDMKENGHMENNMEKENTFYLMEQ